jgi:hypothetical protein
MSKLFGKPESKVIKHPGALTRKAKAAHETNKQWERIHKGDKGKNGEEARLAIRMSKWGKK